MCVVVCVARSFGWLVCVLFVCDFVCLCAVLLLRCFVVSLRLLCCCFVASPFCCVVAMLFCWRVVLLVCCIVVLMAFCVDLSLF